MPSGSFGRISRRAAITTELAAQLDCPASDAGDSFHWNFFDRAFPYTQPLEEALLPVENECRVQRLRAGATNVHNVAERLPCSILQPHSQQLGKANHDPGIRSSTRPASCSPR